MDHHHMGPYTSSQHKHFLEDASQRYDVGMPYSNLHGKASGDYMVHMKL